MTTSTTIGAGTTTTENKEEPVGCEKREITKEGVCLFLWDKEMVTKQNKTEEKTNEREFQFCHNNFFQRSILPTFYEQLFWAYVFYTAFLYLHFVFVMFRQKEIGKKVAHKMLVIFTSESFCFRRVKVISVFENCFLKALF